MKEQMKARERLNARREELTERLQRLTHDRQRLTQPLSPDFADQAVQRENDEVLDRLDESTRAELQQYEHALAHLDRGRYGFCEQCGEDIHPDRLQALPHATLCFDCAAPKKHARARMTGA